MIPAARDTVWKTIGPAEREYGFRAGPVEWIGDWPEMECIRVLDDGERLLDIEPEDVSGMTPLLLDEIRQELRESLEPPWGEAQEREDERGDVLLDRMRDDRLTGDL